MAHATLLRQDILRVCVGVFCVVHRYLEDQHLAVLISRAAAYLLSERTEDAARVGAQRATSIQSYFLPEGTAQTGCQPAEQSKAARLHLWPPCMLQMSAYAYRLQARTMTTPDLLRATAAARPVERAAMPLLAFRWGTSMSRAM